MRTSNPTKPRKPYKITKPRERWNEQEHEKFLEAIDKCVFQLAVSELARCALLSQCQIEQAPFLQVWT